MNPRPSKSPCDEFVRSFARKRRSLSATGMVSGMVSRFDKGGTPKYVWAVDADGQVYEAKTKPPETSTTAIGMGKTSEMRRYILGEWGTRCPQD